MKSNLIDTLVYRYHIALICLRPREKHPIGRYCRPVLRLLDQTISVKEQEVLELLTMTLPSLFRSAINKVASRPLAKNM